MIQPDDEPPPAKPTIRTAAPLHGDELAELVANLRSAPLGVSGTVRVSLGGVQEKLLLTRMTDGSRGRPVDGTPSTHILKPEIAAYPQTVENEVFCMRIAKHLGLAVAEVEMMVVGGRKLLVVERYDRVVGPDGSVASRCTSIPFIGPPRHRRSDRQRGGTLGHVEATRDGGARRWSRTCARCRGDRASRDRRSLAHPGTRRGSAGAAAASVNSRCDSRW